MSGALRGVVRLAVSAALSLLGLTCVTFVIGRFIPVDPVLAIVGDHATQATYDRARLAIGLDRPIPEQYLIYLGKVLHGDLGTSVITSNPVLLDLLHFFPATFELATVATIFGVLFGVPAGVIAGACKGRWPDHLVRVFGLFGYSMPVFWMGLMGLFLFYGKLGWVAGPGRLDAGYEDVLDPVTGVILIDSAMAGAWDVFRNAAAHLVLPSAILGLSLAGLYRPHDAELHDHAALAGLCDDRPDQGTDSVGRRVAPRVPEHSGAADHGRRAELCDSAARGQCSPRRSSRGRGWGFTSRNPCSMPT